MNKKGFTLVELLAVITVLGLIAVILVPTIASTINKAEDNLSKQQINNLITATKKYAVEHPEILPEMEDNESTTIEINDLINNGVIDKQALDIKTNETLQGCIKITYKTSFNQYEYKYSLENCSSN